jgi:hypothetical protein
MLDNFNLQIDIEFLKEKISKLNGSAYKYKNEIIEYLRTGNKEIFDSEETEVKDEIAINHNLDLYLR